MAQHYTSVFGTLMVRTSSVQLALRIQTLSACCCIAPASATDWFIKGRAMCCHVYVRMHVHDPYLSVIRVGHHARSVAVSACWYNSNKQNYDKTKGSKKSTTLRYCKEWVRLSSCTYPYRSMEMQVLCSANVGYIGTDRSLLTGHNALLLRQIARDLLHAL